MVGGGGRGGGGLRREWIGFLMIFYWGLGGLGGVWEGYGGTLDKEASGKGMRIYLRRIFGKGGGRHWRKIGGF